jgi:MOSC domain-containing protein YiiM
MSEMKLLELRAGLPLSVEHFQGLRKEWPEKVHTSSYVKEIVDSVQCSLQGLSGNAPGFPSHIADSVNRAALVYHLGCYDELAKKFPESTKTLVRGGFGENFLVDHPDLHPSVACIGDVYAIGTAEFTVTGPRFPCPKVNSWHYTTGLQQHCLAHCMSGYFVRVSKPGEVRTGDSIRLVKRVNPGYTAQRISQVFIIVCVLYFLSV